MPVERSSPRAEHIASHKNLTHGRGAIAFVWRQSLIRVVAWSLRLAAAYSGTLQSMAVLPC